MGQKCVYTDAGFSPKPKKIVLNPPRAEHNGTEIRHQRIINIC